MDIPNRVKRFIEATNSFCVIMENGQPTFMVAPFSWAEKVFLGADDDSYDLELDAVNNSIAAASQEKMVEDVTVPEA